MSINDFRREMIGDVRGEVCRELLDRLIQETNERKSNLKKQLEAAQQERQDKFYQLSQKKADALAFEDWSQVFREKEVEITSRLFECDEFLRMLSQKYEE